MSGITRDFSQQSVQELRDIIRKNLQDNQWGFFDWFDDTFLMQELNIKNYINNVNEYHAKMIDKHNMGSAEFDRILERVHTVDENYSARINSLVDQAKALQTRIEQLTKMIDPSVITANPGDFARLADGIDSKYQKVKVQSEARMKQCEASMPVLYDKQWYENVVDAIGLDKNSSQVLEGTLCGIVDVAKGLVQGVVDTARGIYNCYQKMLDFTKNPDKKFAEWDNYFSRHPFGLIENYINFKRELPSFLSSQMHKSANDFAKADLKTKSEMLTQLIGNLALIIVPEAAAFKVGEAGEAVELGSKAGSATELAEDMPKIEEGIDAAKDTEEIEGTGEALNGAEKAAEEIENGTKITQGAGEANATIDYVKLSEELGKNIEADGYEVVSTETAEQANADWGDIGFDLPPIAQNTTVYNVKAGNFSYSRVYLDGYNYPKSRFILRTEDIEGLSPQEIAQKYALPKVPNKIVTVELPNDTPLEVSIAGSQKAWGTLGGDVQYAIKDSALKDDWFSNIRDLK